MSHLHHDTMMSNEIQLQTFRADFFVSSLVPSVVHACDSSFAAPATPTGRGVHISFFIENERMKYEIGKDEFQTGG